MIGAALPHCAGTDVEVVETYVVVDDGRAGGNRGRIHLEFTGTIIILGINEI